MYVLSTKPNWSWNFIKRKPRSQKPTGRITEKHQKRQTNSSAVKPHFRFARSDKNAENKVKYKEDDNKGKTVGQSQHNNYDCEAVSQNWDSLVDS